MQPRPQVKAVQPIRGFNLDIPDIYSNYKCTLFTDGKTQFIGLTFQVPKDQKEDLNKIWQIMNLWKNMNQDWIITYKNHKETVFEDPSSYTAEKKVNFKVNFNCIGEIEPLEEYFDD